MWGYKEPTEKEKILPPWRRERGRLEGREIKRTERRNRGREIRRLRLVRWGETGKGQGKGIEEGILSCRTC